MPNSLVFPATTPHPANLSHPVRDEYHGVEVMDEYRWLEDVNDPAVKAWTHAQNRRTRDHLDAIDDREGVLAQLTSLFAQVTPSYSGLVARPCGLFAFKFQPPKQQRLLVTMALANDPGSEKIVLDPNEIEPKGHVAIDWFVPSPDGKLVAVEPVGTRQRGRHPAFLSHGNPGLALTDRIPRAAVSDREAVARPGRRMGWGCFTPATRTLVNDPSGPQFPSADLPSPVGHAACGRPVCGRTGIPTDRRHRFECLARRSLVARQRGQWRWRGICPLPAGYAVAGSLRVAAGHPLRRLCQAGGLRARWHDAIPPARCKAHHAGSSSACRSMAVWHWPRRRSWCRRAMR